jgi:hypothetical protein
MISMPQQFVMQPQAMQVIATPTMGPAMMLMPQFLPSPMMAQMQASWQMMTPCLELTPNAHQKCAVNSPTNDIDMSRLKNVGRSSKGPISKLQEFVQSSKAYPLPSSCPVLQWSHENRMVGSSLHFRATTAFLLDGIPHHVLGGWWPSKKQAQRDAAERSLGFFVGRYGEELAKSPSKGDEAAFNLGEANVIIDAVAAFYEAKKEGFTFEESDEVVILQRFCGHPLRWNCRWEAQPDGEALCQATVELDFLGTPHVFAGRKFDNKAAARADTARRVLWYLHCPGFEDIYQADHELVKIMAQEIPEPAASAWPPLTGQVLTSSTAYSSDNESSGFRSPSNCPSPSTESRDSLPGSPSLSPTDRPDQSELLERKTVVMRLQNRLQKIFAKQLTPGKSVWSWQYDRNQDGMYRASVHIALLEKTFSGGWAIGHQTAQMEACQELLTFLDREYKL